MSQYISVSLNKHRLICMPSVRTAIRESDPDYQITADSWWAGLYPIDKFDPTHPDARLFTNILLLKVQYSFFMHLQY